MKLIFNLLASLFIFFFATSSKAVEIECQFEEVYLNGEFQNGILLMKDKFIRYQYLNQKLYTIIVKNNDDIYLIDNSNKKNVQKIEDNFNVFKKIMMILELYPNIDSVYQDKSLKLIIEKGSNIFLKRIAIQSKDLNLSIHFNNCEEKILNSRFFNWSPFFDFNK